MVVKGLKKKTVHAQKKINLRFVVDCTAPVNDKVLDVNGLEQFFRDRIKVDNKTGNLGTSVSVSREGKAKVVVEAGVPMAKRYVKYLTKKYLKKQQLRDFLRVLANKKDSYELRYFKMTNEEEETE